MLFPIHFIIFLEVNYLIPIKIVISSFMPDTRGIVGVRDGGTTLTTVAASLTKVKQILF
jgi:hypothetical protein